MVNIERRDVVQVALERLTSNWKDKPRVVGLVTTFVSQLQDIEDTLHQLNNERGIHSAVGVQLDTLGLLFDVPRDGLLDEDYRDAIKAKIALSDASGTISDVVEITKLITGGTNSIAFEHYPACTYVYVNAPVSAATERNMQKAHAGGVRTRAMWFDGDGHFKPSSPSTANATGFLLATGVDDNIAVTDFQGTHDLIVNPSIGVEGTGSSLTSLLPDVDDYQVVDDKGKFLSLAAVDTDIIQTGYIVDHEGRFIVSDKNEYIRYIKFT